MSSRRPSWLSPRLDPGEGSGDDDDGSDDVDDNDDDDNEDADDGGDDDGAGVSSVGGGRSPGALGVVNPNRDAIRSSERVSG